MKYLIFIALGGASGAVARHILAGWVHSLWEGNMPVGTLMVNALGSFAIGILYILIVERNVLHPDWQSVLMVGFLGAFTTFSTFSLESIALLEAGHIITAAAYILASVVIGIVSAGLGMYLMRTLA